MTSLFSACHNIHKFALLRGRRLLLLEAALWLALIRVAKRIMPFHRLVRHFGVLTPPAAGARDACHELPPPEHVELARDISWAVSLAARHAPFEVVCLPQAIAAKAMLQRRGVRGAIYFGAAKDAAGLLEAHAWLRAAGVEVTGYPVPSHFITIACFI